VIVPLQAMAAEFLKSMGHLPSQAPLFNLQKIEEQLRRGGSRLLVHPRRRDVDDGSDRARFDDQPHGGARCFGTAIAWPLACRSGSVPTCCHPGTPARVGIASCLRRAGHP
jgi:hypothetical protein